jgi:hypothetical protein
MLKNRERIESRKRQESMTEDAGWRDSGGCESAKSCFEKRSAMALKSVKLHLPIDQSAQQKTLRKPTTSDETNLV